MTKVSIVIPLYKAEKYIVKCLDSLRRQTLKDFEVIVVNDCSPDNSRDIVLNYSHKDNRFKLIENDQNRGPMASRYVGILASVGEFITFLDSDDTLPVDALEKLYNHANETQSDIVCGAIERVDGDGVAYYKINSQLPYGDNKIGFIKAILNRYVPQMLCSKLYKRDLLKDKSYIIYERCVQAEDAAFLFQCCEYTNKVSVIDDVVYNYFVNPSSEIRETSLFAFDCICKMTLLRENILGKYAELNFFRKRYFTENLYKSRIDKEKVKLLKNYSLEHYISWGYIIKYLKPRQSAKYIIKYLLHTLKIRRM